MPDVIEISGLVKTFGRVRALDGLDMTVREGEVHGFLGPNGAGKSTTLRVLLGRLRGGADAKRRDELIERFALDPRKKARTYSKGNRQKVALSAALASEVELLLLDEPTSGLDPLMEAVFREVINEERRAGRTVLLSSHILAEVEALCDRVSIIRDGRIVEAGTLAQLRHLTRISVMADLARVPDGGLPHVHELSTEGHRVRFQADPEHIGDVLARLAEYGVRDITAQPPTLEELFMRHYR
ncbi:ATP-binding cassette domain-containing protein [Nonomuraea sp. NPDC048882]|uniref:ABC transporter ATP-binding protein n=1 Tax=unclassified Nonomuraea TaxID=2593643 RepID=UPI0034096DE8